VLGAVQVLMILHIIQWLVTGSTLSPVEPSESMEFVTRGVVNAGTVFFALALLSTLIFGRWFCGWGCHMVMLQDLCLWLLRRVGIRPRPFRSRVLVYVPFLLALYMFVWPLVYRLGLVPISQSLNHSLSWIPALESPAPIAGLSTEFVTTEFWKTFPGLLIAVPFLLICGFATVYFLGAKGLCTYGCPYGGFFAPLDQFSPARIRVTDACEQCGHCTAVCTSNVRVHEEVAAYGMVVDTGCMKCLDCVSVCPNDALYFGFGKPASTAKPRSELPARRADYAWWQEIILALLFVGSFLAWRGIYEAVPMLMAAGLAGCLTFILWKSGCVAFSKNESFHRWRLRYHGRLLPAGRWFIAVGVIALLATLHCGAVTMITAHASALDGRVRVPKSAVFSTNPVALPEEMEDDARAALAAYQGVAAYSDGGFGLRTVPSHFIRRAWLHAALQELPQAEALLRAYESAEGEHDETTRDIAMLLRMQLREEDAERFVRERIAAEPRFVQATDALLVWLQDSGRAAEAISLCRTQLERLPENAESASHGGGNLRLHLMRRLSLLLLASGEIDESIRWFEETLRIEPDNPAARAIYAKALLERGDDARAIEEMTRAAELSDDPKYQEELARLLESLGRRDDADRVRESGAGSNSQDD